MIPISLGTIEIDRRILDTFMEYALEHGLIGLADLADIPEGQRTFIQLAILHLAAHKLGDHGRNLLLRRLRDGANSSLHGIRQHQNCRLCALRLRTIVAEIVDIHVFLARLFDRLGIEIHGSGIAMMLLNHIDDRSRQMMLARQFYAVAGMLGENRRRYARIGLIMRILANLILLEIQRTHKLADVMIICAHAGEHRIRADGLCRSFRQISHDHGMMIGARRFDHKPAKQRLIRIRKLDKLGRRDQIESCFQNRLQAHTHDRRCDSAQHRMHHNIKHAAHTAGHKRIDAQQQRHICRADDQTRDKNIHAGRIAAHQIDGEHAAHIGHQQDTEHLRGFQTRAGNGEERDQHRNREIEYIRRTRAKQIDHQHGRKHHRHGVHADILAKYETQRQRDHRRNEHNKGIFSGMEHLRSKEHDEQIRDRQDNRHDDGNADIRPGIKAVSQKTQCLQHSNLLRADTVALHDDVLILLIDRRLHSLIGAKAILFCCLLVDEHIGLQTGTQRRDSHVIPQIGTRIISNNLLNIVDCVVNLTFGDGGYQCRTRSRSDRMIERFEIALSGVHHRTQLIVAQLDLREHMLGLAVILIGESSAVIRPCSADLRAQLTHGTQLRKSLIQIRHDGVGNGIILKIHRRDRIARHLTPALGGDLVHDIAAGRDRLRRHIAHAQIILLRRNGQKTDHKQHSINQQPEKHLLHAMIQAVNP